MGALKSRRRSTGLLTSRLACQRLATTRRARSIVNDADRKLIRPPDGRPAGQPSSPAPAARQLRWCAGPGPCPLCGFWLPAAAESGSKTCACTRATLGVLRSLLLGNPQVKPSVYLGPRGVHRTLVNRDGLHLQVGLPRAQREAWNHCSAVLSLKQAWVEALCWPESCGRGGVAMKRPRQAGQHLPAAVLWDPART